MLSVLASNNEKFTSFIVEEFKEAMFSIPQCSRSDGFSIRFYQHFLNFLKY